MIKKNIDMVLGNIAAACERVGRSPEEVTLIAVSKTKPVEDLELAMNAGIVHFGENKVQELTAKIEYFNNLKIMWHMIGHLQTNKVKYIVDKVSLIHSVDSIELATKISKLATQKNVTANILIEVNVALEDSKFGVTLENTLPLIEAISGLSNICVRGLMTVAPYVDNPEDNRMIFRQLKELAQTIKSRNIANVTMDVLSMGMTNDYEVAIEEGATMVRVGTAIFGNRIYQM